MAKSTLGLIQHPIIFKGIDDIRIYDRFYQQEIKSLYAVADPNPPRLVSSSPNNQYLWIGVSDNITVYFDKPLDKNTVNLPNVELKVQIIIQSLGLFPLITTRSPLILLTISVLWTTTHFLKSGIRDQLGNNLSPTQITFQTQMLGGGSSAEPFLISSEEGLRKIHRESKWSLPTDQ